MVFHQDANLCLQSGLKFYNDQNGINLINQICSGSQQRRLLKPEVFQNNQVYYQYFYNSEALPEFQRQNYKSKLPCIVFAIPSKFGMSCWAADSVGNAFLLMDRDPKFICQQLSNILRVTVDTFEKVQGPNLIKQHLVYVISRTLRRIRKVCSRIERGDQNKDTWFTQHLEVLQVSKEFLLKTLKDVEVLKDNQQKQQPNVLYSSYLQELIEMLALFFSPLPFVTKGQNFSFSPIKNISEVQLPDWLYSFINMNILFEYMKGESELTEEMYREVVSNLKTEMQWERFIYVESLPKAWTVEFTKKKITDIVEKQKGRILHPVYDVLVPGD